jgi:hypothetical protein
MDGLLKFLSDTKVLEALGLAFILLVLLAFALWKMGILKLENPTKPVIQAVEGFCPDPGCKEEICTKLDSIEGTVSSLLGKVSAVQGGMDVLIKWVQEKK